VNYPTMEEVEKADRIQLCRWYRFLPSPGSSAIGNPGLNFRRLLAKQIPIMDRIAERLKEFGGFTPEISKLIGWENK